MIALRAGSETLKYGAFEPLFANRRVMAYARTLGSERYVVLLNFSGHAARADAAGEVVAANTDLRAYAGLGRDLAVIGAGTRAEIWDAQSWREYLAVQEDVFSNQAEEVIPGMF